MPAAGASCGTPACSVSQASSVPRPCGAAIEEVEPLFDTALHFTHARDHNIYFDDEIEGLEAGHPALSRHTTVNHTICGDQIPASTIAQVYEWEPLIDFLAAALEKPRLYPMADPLGRINVMAYGAGERLNWHFDRAEFTITILLQAPLSGGEFRYRSGLRSDSDPNYEGVARLLTGHDERVQTLPLAPGTLNVFKGKNTAHRVTPVEGERAQGSSPSFPITRGPTSPSAIGSVWASTAGPAPWAPRL